MSSILYFSNDNYLLASSYNIEDIDNFINNVNKLLKSDEKVAYLTFDDGPSPSITPKILDILEKENIKATFFVIEKKLKSILK